MPPAPQSERDRYERILESVATMGAQLARLLSDVQQLTRGAQDDRELVDQRHQENTKRIDDIEGNIKFARRVVATLFALVTLLSLLWAPMHDIIGWFRGQ